MFKWPLCKPEWITEQVLIILSSAGAQPSQLMHWFFNQIGRFSPGRVRVCGIPDAAFRCRNCIEQTRRRRLLQAEGHVGPHQVSPETQPELLREYKLEPPLFPGELNWQQWSLVAKNFSFSFYFAVNVQIFVTDESVHANVALKLCHLDDLKYLND